jgi:hypothetical protein
MIFVFKKYGWFIVPHASIFQNNWFVDITQCGGGKTTLSSIYFQMLQFCLWGSNNSYKNICTYLSLTTLERLESKTS